MSSAATPIAARPLPEKIGRYRILCELGHGAMAVIYLGRALGPRNFERLFAIKTIHEHLCRESSFVDMFVDEAKLAARIHHPNVIPVYEVDAESGRYFIAMEYVSGESLATTLKNTWTRGRPFPIDIALHIVAEACEGLHAAHELKDSENRPLHVVHRDVAPQNIMLGYDGTVRMMDFGIAKAVDRVSGTRPGTLKGTVAYMSPEQVRTEKGLDRRADVFGLGVVLWETTVGKRLFKSDNDIHTAARVMRMNIPLPSTLRENYPPKLDEIIMRALSRDRAKRQPSARALGEELRDLLASEKMRVAAPDVERFMKDVFGEMYEERAEMERKATAEVPPGELHAPDRGDASNSLSEVDAGLIEEEESSDLYDAFEYASVSSSIPEHSTERTIPTAIIRTRTPVEDTPSPLVVPVHDTLLDELEPETTTSGEMRRDLTVRVDMKDTFGELKVDSEAEASLRAIERNKPLIYIGAIGAVVLVFALAFFLSQRSTMEPVRVPVMAREVPVTREAPPPPVVHDVAEEEAEAIVAAPPPVEEKIAAPVEEKIAAQVEEKIAAPALGAPQTAAGLKSDEPGRSSRPAEEKIAEPAAPVVKKEKRAPRPLKMKPVKRAVKEAMPPPPRTTEKKKPALIGGDDL